MIMMVTGLPKIPLFVIGCCCGGLAFTLTAQPEQRGQTRRPPKEREKITAAKKEPEKVEKLLDVDTLELEVGYGPGEAGR